MAQDLINIWRTSTGDYPLRAARAQQIDSSLKVKITQPFIFRPTANGADIIGSEDEITDSVAKIKAVYGNTIGWNMLLKSGENGVTTSGITVSDPTSSLRYTITGTATADVEIPLFVFTGASGKNDKLIPGHVYYIKGLEKLENMNKGGFYWEGCFNEEYLDHEKDRIIFTCLEGENPLGIFIPNGQTINITIKPMLFDLTLMFGPGNEPLFSEAFDYLFPLLNYGYNAGTLISFIGRGIQTIGFNRWDEETQLGVYSQTNGVISKATSATALCSKNLIPVIPNTKYVISIQDGNLTKLGGIYEIYENAVPAKGEMIAATLPAEKTFEFTTSEKAAYLVFNFSSAYGTSYADKICLSFYWTGYRSGEYEAYEKQENTNLFNPQHSVLRSALNTADQLYTTKFVQCVNDKTIGDAGLEWAKATDDGIYFYAALTDSKTFTVGETPDLLIAGYKTVSVSDFNEDKTATIKIISSVPYLCIRDSAQESNTAAQFKTNKSLIEFTYALETPITTFFSPYLDFEYLISDYGTEGVITAAESNSADLMPITAPMFAEIQYQQNLRDKLQRMPTNDIIIKGDYVTTFDGAVLKYKPINFCSDYQILKMLAENDLIVPIIDQEVDYFCITALNGQEASFLFSNFYINYGDEDEYQYDYLPVDLEYSFDKVNWIKFGRTKMIQPIVFTDKVYFRGNNEQFASFEQDDQIIRADKFYFQGDIKLSGDVSTLFYQYGGLKEIKINDEVISEGLGPIPLFVDNENIIDASQLILNIMCPYCYYDMFDSCTSLTQVPKLPATTLAEGCYEYMFSNCTSLTEVPELPATILAEGCYQGMFSNCTSLTQAPELPATTLASNCYGYMFNSCTSLTEAPELPATILASNCYESMFYNCTSLTEAPELPATVLAETCYRDMFSNCTSLTQVPELPAIELAQGCYWYMFYNCTSLNNITIGFTEFTLPNATTLWLYDVAENGTIYVPNGFEYPATRDASTIPTSWTIIPN